MNYIELNRKKRRELNHLSVGAKRLLMAELRLELAKITLKRNDPVLDSNLMRWNAYISGRRTDGISVELVKMIEFVNAVYEEYKEYDLEEKHDA